MELKNKNIDMNWMSVLGLCLIVLGTVFSFFGTYKANKKSQSELSSKIQEKNEIIEDINRNNITLIDQNSTLLNSNYEVSGTNRDLISQNSEMLNKIAKYQSDIEARNLKIQELEKEISDVKEYSYYANLNIFGKAIDDGDIIFSSDLSNRMGNILTQKDGKVNVIMDKNKLALIDEVIAKYPSFPFGYYAKCQILKYFGDNSWKIYAKKGIEILEVTTSIHGHHINHDQVLKVLNGYMKTN